MNRRKNSSQNENQWSVDLVQALELDRQDELAHFRNEFEFPESQTGLYFAGHSLGLMPKKARRAIETELDSWSKYAVEGHFHGPHPWLPYHEELTPLLKNLVGAKTTEVVAMNSLTVNLHLMLVSFFKPSGKRTKILIENNTFPSDRYAVESQLRFHGLDPKEHLLVLEPENGGFVVSEENLLNQIQAAKDELALVLLGDCNYLSGQSFPITKIVDSCHSSGIKFGLNLAHGAGNLKLELHNWGVDFAVWCSYKYLNAGPGGIAGCFVHEKHLNNQMIPKFAGWWGHDKKSRFLMQPEFQPIPTVESWQLSNPPIFQLASLRASLEIFESAGMDRLAQKSKKLTDYFEFLLIEKLGDQVEIITPKDRGAMLCLKFMKNPKEVHAQLAKKGAILDFREPNILRATPAPLYTRYEDVWKLVDLLAETAK